MGQKSRGSPWLPLQERYPGHCCALFYCPWKGLCFGGIAPAWRISLPWVKLSSLLLSALQPRQTVLTAAGSIGQASGELLRQIGENETDERFQVKLPWAPLKISVPGCSADDLSLFSWFGPPSSSPGCLDEPGQSRGQRRCHVGTESQECGSGGRGHRSAKQSHCGCHAVRPLHLAAGGLCKGASRDGWASQGGRDSSSFLDTAWLWRAGRTSVVCWSVVGEVERSQTNLHRPDALRPAAHLFWLHVLCCRW